FNAPDSDAHHWGLGQVITERLNRQPQSLAKGPHPAASLIAFSARSRLGATLARGLCKSLHHAAVACFHLSHEWKASLNTEQARVSGINAGDEGIRQDEGGFSPSPSPNKGIYRFVGFIGSPTPETFRQNAQLATPTKKIALKKGH